MFNFVCEVEFQGSDCAAGSRSSRPIAMAKGEARYLELIGFNNGGADRNLLTLTMAVGEKDSFTTSDVLGLSAEFFREIRTDAPAISVVVNGLTAACGAVGGSCNFEYSADLSPRVTSIIPLHSYPGITDITITGIGFKESRTLNSVTIGPTACEVTSANTTYITCFLPRQTAVAGTFTPVINVYNLGNAVIPSGLQHTVEMTIDSVYPTNGSVLGGATLTITGAGFANFGLYNQIKLLVHNKSDVKSTRLHNFFEDDWSWGRGSMNTSTGFDYVEVLCIPKTMRNFACRATPMDSGYDCVHQVAWAYDSAEIRDSAYYFDWSTPTYIECELESFQYGLVDGTVAAVNISLVNQTTMLDSVALAASIAATRLDQNCEALAHCKMFDS